MQYIWSFLLYICTLLTLGVIGYIVFDGAALDVALSILFVSWSLIYLYLDKLVLVYLSAREVIDTDEQQLFQDIKNEVYKTNIEKPNVFLYHGNSKNCFVLESRGSWSVVIEKGMLRKLSADQLKHLVEFLFLFRKSGKPHIQTKIMGISSLIFLSIYWLVKHLVLLFLFVTFTIGYIYTESFVPSVQNIAILGAVVIALLGYIYFYKTRGTLYLNRNGRLFRALSLFLISLVRPVLLLFQAISRRRLEIPAHPSLKPIVMSASHDQYSLDKFLVEHFKGDIQLKDMILEYIEGFPLLEFCHFKENEY